MKPRSRTTASLSRRNKRVGDVSTNQFLLNRLNFKPFLFLVLYICYKVKPVVSSRDEKPEEEQFVGLHAWVNKLGKPNETTNWGPRDVWFTFELTGVSEFFRTKDNSRSSQKFCCQDMWWSICVQRRVGTDKVKRLGVFLKCHNDTQTNWICSTHFELIVFNHLSENLNRVKKKKFIFKKGNTSWGEDGIIKFSELADERTGYIKDDKIVVGVELKPGPNASSC